MNQENKTVNVHLEKREKSDFMVFEFDEELAVCLNEENGQSELKNVFSVILTELIKQKCINKKIWTKIVEKGCFHFIEESLCSKDMSLLYNTANAYLSPYLAEAFNMPVLEATACGLVTVTTGNGPTAEFVCPTSSIQIPSIRVQAANGRYVLIINDLYFENSLLKLLDDPKALQRAREDGPLWVGERFTWARVVQILQGVMQSTMKPSMRNPDFFC